jgi:type IV pilus assembly protein PilO
MELDLKNKNTQQLILAVLVGCLFLAMYVNLLLRPTLASLSKINPEIRKLKQDIGEVTEGGKTKSQLSQRLKRLEGKVTKYEAVLSAEEEIPSLLQELSELAEASGIRIIGIKPGRPPKLEDKKKVKSRIVYQEIPISIKATCGYHQLGSFIAALENADRLFIIRDIEIKSSLQTPRSHDVGLVVSTFLVLES